MADRDKDIRKFQRAADQRLTAAALLLDNGFHLESIYLAGYSIECALKALIIKLTPRAKHRVILKRLTEVGAKGHDYEYLKGILRRKPISYNIPVEIAVMITRATSWSTDLRYEVGTVPHRDADRFLNSAKAICDWVERS